MQKLEAIAELEINPKDVATNYLFRIPRPRVVNRVGLLIVSIVIQGAYSGRGAYE
jgi:hypothetical protein